MRRRKLTIGLLSMMMAASVTFGIQGNDVHAASKKLSVNRVYENAKLSLNTVYSIKG